MLLAFDPPPTETEDFDFKEDDSVGPDFEAAALPTLVLPPPAPEVARTDAETAMPLKEGDKAVGSFEEGDNAEDKEAIDPRPFGTGYENSRPSTDKSGAEEVELRVMPCSKRNRTGFSSVTTSTSRRSVLKEPAFSSAFLK